MTDEKPMIKIDDKEYKRNELTDVQINLVNKLAQIEQEKNDLKILSEFYVARFKETFKKSLTKEACGNCGLYSNRRSFCGRFGAKAVKDNYICHEWRKRFFQR